MEKLEYSLNFPLKKGIKKVKKMKTFLDRTKISAILIITVVITSVFAIMATNTVQAVLAPDQPYSGPLRAGDVPDGSFDTDVWISVSPRVVGLGQMILVNAWATPASHAHRRLHDFHIIII